MVGCLESSAVTCPHAWQDALWLFGGIFFFFTGGCSSTRKDTSPQTRRWAPSTPKWKEWVTPTWTEAKGSGMLPTTSSLHRLVRSQLGPSRDAGTLAVFVTWLLIGQYFVSHLLQVIDRCWRDCGKFGSDPTSTKAWIKLPVWINIRLTQTGMMEELCCQNEARLWLNRDGN